MEKLFISRQSRHSDFNVSVMLVRFPICFLIWRVNNYVSRQGKGLNSKNESTQRNCCYLLCYNNIESFYFVSYVYFLTAKNLIFQIKKFSVVGR